MKVNFLELKRLYRMTEHEIDRGIRHVLESGHYVLGSACSGFEAAMKETLVGDSAGFVIGCNSGTDALILPMLCLDIKTGDEVLTVSHTAIPTITAIRATGATPVFCDIDPNTWLMDISDCVKQAGPRTKAVIAVHLYGNMVDIPKLRQSLDHAGFSHVKIIEDCAQAQGSYLTIDGRYHQAGVMGDYAAYSFYPTKNVGALGDGGAVFTKDPDHADRLRMLRFYGQKDRYNALIDRGLNSRLDELQAAILSVRLKYLNKWGDKKDVIRARYLADFETLPLRPQLVTDNCHPNLHLFVVALNDPSRRDHTVQKLADLGVQCLIHYPKPTHMQNAFSKYWQRALPVTETLANSILSIPMYPGLTPEEVEFVSSSVCQVLG